MSDEFYPVELTPPDISAYRAGNTGIDYATTFESGVAGPHVMVNAVTHGNELCGAIVLDYLFHHDLRPTKGKLTLSFANYMAFLRFDANYPATTRFVDEDFNRLWSADVLDGDRDSVELVRAREMRPLIDQVDYLLDIHSMQTSVAPLIMTGPLDKGRALAQGVGYPEYVVSDKGHAAGTRMRDYAEFGDPASEKNALLIEAGQHWETSTADVALETTLHFLDHLGVIDPEFVAENAADEPGPQKVVEVTEAVTIRHDVFTFAEPYVGLEVIADAGTMLGHDGDEPVTTPYDDCVLIMPSRRLLAGQTAVRLGRFVE